MYNHPHFAQPYYPNQYSNHVPYNYQPQQYPAPVSQAYIAPLEETDSHHSKHTSSAIVLPELEARFLKLEQMVGDSHKRVTELEAKIFKMDVEAQETVKKAQESDRICKLMERASKHFISSLEKCQKDIASATALADSAQRGWYDANVEADAVALQMKLQVKKEFATLAATLQQQFNAELAIIRDEIKVSVTKLQTPHEVAVSHTTTSEEPESEEPESEEPALNEDEPQVLHCLICLLYTVLIIFRLQDVADQPLSRKRGNDNMSQDSVAATKKLRTDQKSTISAVFDIPTTILFISKLNSADIRSAIIAQINKLIAAKQLTSESYFVDGNVVRFLDTTITKVAQMLFSQFATFSHTKVMDNLRKRANIKSSRLGKFGSVPTVGFPISSVRI